MADVATTKYVNQLNVGPIMKAVALALILVVFGPTPLWAAGWYLMVPPVRGGPFMFAKSFMDIRRAVDGHAPFDAWTTHSSFDSAEACNSERGRLSPFQGLSEAMDKVLHDFASSSYDDRSRVLLYAQYAEALCIASDDQRLSTVVRKQWYLITPPLIQKWPKSTKYLDETFIKNAPPKQWQILSSHSSGWECENQKEYNLMVSLDS